MGSQNKRMSFGCHILDNEAVLFRIWAPKAILLELLIYDASDNIRLGITPPAHILPMSDLSDGWFELISEKASEGTLYAYRIDNQQVVPDYASRFQPSDVHGPSQVINPDTGIWTDHSWIGRPWEEAVIYEIHIGCYTPTADFNGVIHKLDYLVDLGVTALEIMPVADFPGRWNWGYDGVYLFAPDSTYGRPDDFKRLIDESHKRGLMVFLDVVYNHFGPEGNYIHSYAPVFFTDRYTTPWGNAINFDGEDSKWVREFFIENALFWINEYHLDGLRFDAAHAIYDATVPNILTEISSRIKRTIPTERHVHLILENADNRASYLERNRNGLPEYFTAQWNDDVHHILHVILTRETDGYYIDYSHRPLHLLARCLTEGFAYQGDISQFMGGIPRGEASSHLPLTAFINFLQNHDQIGNRAFGDRINILSQEAHLRACIAILLLAPSPPLLFMGQEWGCTQPFLFFCDLSPDLGIHVTEGRRQEFAHFSAFNVKKYNDIPDPMNPDTYAQSILDWPSISHSENQTWLTLHHELLEKRRRYIVPRLKNIKAIKNEYTALTDCALSGQWLLADGAELYLLANLGDEAITDINLPLNQILYCTHHDLETYAELEVLPPWCVIWYLHPHDDGEV